MLLYDQFVYIQTFVLSLMSEDEAAILSASQVEMAVIPQSVFMQEDVLLEVLLSGLTVEIVSNFVLDIGWLLRLLPAIITVSPHNIILI